jgi:predicted phage terminase large subunit-like protein
VKITAEHVEALAGLYLSPHYDQPVATPNFHREGWTLYCSEAQAVAIAAPRGHAKSTAFTHDFTLTNVLLRTEDYIILVGSSEEMAVEHLGDIANELRENEALINHFKISRFVQDQKTDIIVECKDGHQFRILARGSEQKIRGRKWRGKRPGLLVGDDLEDDEQVESKDRRRKFSRWFFRAAKQTLRRGGRIRIHGTILHQDSLLMNLIRNKSWVSKRYRAHKAFNDFSQILWPEAYPERVLKAIRQEFINAGDSAGYAQEYLNDPQDFEDRFLREEQFRPMSDTDKERFKLFYAGVDFAISKADTANKTSFTVGGQDSENITHITDVRASRMDALEIIEEFFFIQECWNIQVFFVEDGQIWKAIKPVLMKEMQRRDEYINFVELTPVKDKKARARSFQKRMKAGVVRFNTETSWFQDYKEECLLFTGDSEAMADDQFDSTATLFLGMESMPDTEDDDEMMEEDQDLAEAAQWIRDRAGRSRSTGY